MVLGWQAVKARTRQGLLGFSPEARNVGRGKSRVGRGRIGGDGGENRLITVDLWVPGSVFDG
jgi:hypothetical protein